MIDVLEIFVSLLRNKEKTQSVDVELFFSDYAKLVSKMSKTETTSVSLDLVNSHHKALEGMRGNFTRSTVAGALDLSQFEPFLEWSRNFCLAA